MSDQPSIKPLTEWHNKVVDGSIQGTDETGEALAAYDNLNARLAYLESYKLAAEKQWLDMHYTICKSLEESRRLLGELERAQAACEEYRKDLEHIKEQSSHPWSASASSYALEAHDYGQPLLDRLKALEVGVADAVKCLEYCRDDLQGIALIGDTLARLKPLLPLAHVKPESVEGGK